MDLQAHVDVFFSHLPPDVGIDVLVCNDGVVDQGALAGLEALAGPVDHPRVGQVVTADLSDAAGSHDPARLATVLSEL